MENQKIGENSISLKNPVYILDSACVVGKREGQGPLHELFDVIGEDDMFGCKTWEEAESTLQKEAMWLVLKKTHLKPRDCDVIFAGDLLGQCMASSFGIEGYAIPFYGVYGACSTCGEMLSLGAMVVAGGFGKVVACVTSSHFASAEKEFRFPLEYGNQRPLSATFTVTGSGAFVLAGEEMRGFLNKRGRAKIEGITIGKIVDFGIKDSMNMGACMAPAAASCIRQHFWDFNRGPKDYDKIITGDLGTVGSEILIHLLAGQGIDISGRHIDCGVEIYDVIRQDKHAGGSGCGCSAVTLSAYILKMLEEEKWSRVLFVPTGALLSKTSFNEGQSVPGIAHGVVIAKVS